jgi:hypothetical protein
MITGCMPRIEIDYLLRYYDGFAAVVHQYVLACVVPYNLASIVQGHDLASVIRHHLFLFNCHSQGDGH